MKAAVAGAPAAPAANNAAQPTNGGAQPGGDSKGRPMIKIRYIGPTGYHDTIDAVKQ